MLPKRLVDQVIANGYQVVKIIRLTDSDIVALQKGIGGEGAVIDIKTQDWLEATGVRLCRIYRAEDHVAPFVKVCDLDEELIQPDGMGGNNSLRFYDNSVVRHIRGDNYSVESVMCEIQPFDSDGNPSHTALLSRDEIVWLRDKCNAVLDRYPEK